MQFFRIENCELEVRSTINLYCLFKDITARKISMNICGYYVLFRGALLYLRVFCDGRCHQLPTLLFVKNGNKREQYNFSNF